VRITGLNPDTKYFYRFGSSTLALQQGTDNYFMTAPQTSTSRKIRIAAFW
jgi:phosphodiesterase/alkaline phosphatase D-like protein